MKGEYETYVYGYEVADVIFKAVTEKAEDEIAHADARSAYILGLAVMKSAKELLEQEERNGNRQGG